MVLRSEEIVNLLQAGDQSDPLVITPQPGLESLRVSGSASVNLRLGTWLLKLQQNKSSHIEIGSSANSALTKTYYVPFGKKFMLHPRSFILGATIEWIRLPKNLAGYVIGRSSWGRRGLLIATATGVHPGFTGCLTLEITNVGEMPIELMPGLEICQLFLHDARGPLEYADKSNFVGLRRPTLGKIEVDEVAKKLMAST